MVLIITNTNIVIYVVLNTRSINFKGWIKDILVGYNIIDQYKNSSIFIIENKFYKEQQPNREQLCNTVIENDTSDLTSIEGESIINDDYMKNFKINITTEKSFSKNS